MTESEAKELIAIIFGLKYGEITIKKEAGKITVIKKTESIKLSDYDPEWIKRHTTLAFDDVTHSIVITIDNTNEEDYKVIKAAT